MRQGAAFLGLAQSVEKVVKSTQTDMEWSPILAWMVDAGVRITMRCAINVSRLNIRCHLQPRVLVVSSQTDAAGECNPQGTLMYTRSSITCL